MGDKETSDDVLIARMQEGDDAAASRLILRYMPLVRYKAGHLAKRGLERDDLMQEGLIGFLGAVRAYRSDRGSSFATFASHCITNRMLSALSLCASSGKLPLAEDSLPDASQWERMLPDVGADPQEVVIAREENGARWRHMSGVLSPFEYRTLWLYLGGHTYLEIASLLDSTTKAVDNALVRARKKLRAVR